ncbi:MAG: phage tail tube protein [Thermotogota bacterium]
MQGIGAETKWAIFKETVFRQLRAAEPLKRIALIEESHELDKGFENPNEITGTRTALVKVPMKSQVSGAINITGAPENGFAELLSAACGGYTTIAGAFKRYFGIGAGTTLTLAGAPVTPNSEEVYVRAVPLPGVYTPWIPLTKSLAPGADEYDIDNLTGEITFGDDQTGKQIFVNWCKVVAGVYSHIIKPADVPFFGLWSTKGNVDLFEYAGCAVNGASLESSSEGFLGLSCDLISAKEYIASIDVTGHSFPSNLTLSPLSLFKMAQARVFVDYLADARLNKVSWEIANNLDPYWSLNCDDAISKIYPAVQENNLGISVVFDRIDDYAKFKREEFFSVELEYGGCAATGVEIGATGETYRFYAHFPRFRFETAPLPVSTGKMMLEGGGMANLETGMDRAYKAVIVNGQATLWS